MASSTSGVKLKKLLESFWIWRLGRTPEFASLVGDKTHDNKLEVFNPQRFSEDESKCKEFLQQAKAIEDGNDLLTESERLNLKIFQAELSTFVDGYKFKGFLFPINFLEGVQVDFQRLPGWMTFEIVKDYQNLLERYDAFPKQAEDICETLKLAVSQGFVNHAHSMDGVLDQLREHQKPAEETEFYKPFHDSKLPDIEMDHLKNMAKETIRTKIIPSMLRIAKVIETEYLPKTRRGIGITSLPVIGKGFYESCLKFHTATNLTPKEIHDIGLSEVERIEKSIRKIADELGYKGVTLKDFFIQLRLNKDNFFSSKEKLMARFKEIVEEQINPKLSNLFWSIPSLPLEIIEAPPSMGKGPAAYYISGTADGSRPGRLFVNTSRYDSQPSYECVSLALHEGNPGHHLQASYCMVADPPLPKFRQVMEDRSYFMAPSRFPINTSYVEGWALYCESLGNDMDLYNDPYDKLGHYSEDIFRACRLVVDPGLHALGWSRCQAIDYMKTHTAASDDNIVAEVDRYITWPGQATGYKIGEMKIKELRMRCEKELKEAHKFDIRDFHEIVLRCCGPLNILEEEVNKFIKDKLRN